MLQPGYAGARRMRGMGRHLAVGCLAQRASRRHEGRERRLLGLAMAGQTNATDIVKLIASIAFGSCT